MISFREKLNKLPQDKVAELELIIGKIVDTGLAEMVILYGSYARGDFKDGKIINVEGSRVQRRSDYDILVVIDQEDDTQEIEKFYNGFTSPKMIGSTEIKIRKALRGMNLPIQIIVEQIGYDSPTTCRG
jgi:predicted nucleotidyltransferase